MGGEGEVVCGLLNKTEKNKLKKINQNSFALDLCTTLTNSSNNYSRSALSISACPAGGSFCREAPLYVFSF